MVPPKLWYYSFFSGLFVTGIFFYGEALTLRCLNACNRKEQGYPKMLKAMSWTLSYVFLLEMTEI